MNASSLISVTSRSIATALLLAIVVAAVAAEKPPVNDNVIYDRVIRRLANDRDLKTTAIEVSVKDRVVTLRGLIEAEKLRQRAERVVQKVDGVKKVVNELRIRP
ncbi:MAG: BON domain-containing protein [Acidobacteria bacterium]|nr:BON domain-containing protein [Acidobacteriota bacterium]